MEPIRVLNVVTKMDAAGIETLLMNFYRNIDRSKVQFDFLTHRSKEGFYDKEILQLGGKIYNVPPINPLNHRNYINALDTFFYVHKDYKIVHSHINTFSMYPLRAAMKADIPVRIAHSHIANVPVDLKSPFRLYTKFKLKNYSTHNFACSEIAGKWLFGSNAILKDSFNIINNSIDASKYQYNELIEKRIRSELKLDGKFVIGHIGRFNKQKNHTFLIDVFKEIHKREPNSVLILIGEGELESLIKDKVREIGLTNSVIFAGVRSDVHDLLQAMDVFLFPSIYEGLGIVVVEAQAAGVRCIVSEEVPKEAILTDLIKSKSLSSGAISWAEDVVKLADLKKRNTLSEIKKAGFDIMDQVKDLEVFYTQALLSIDNK